jgi:hypothetical protein
MTLKLVKRKHPYRKGKHRMRSNTNGMKHGAFSKLDHKSIDQRTTLAKLMAHARRELMTALGGEENITPQERILISRIGYKMVRITLFEQHHLGADIENDVNRYYILWTNSLRLDLQALGLERRAKAVVFVYRVGA